MKTFMLFVELTSEPLDGVAVWQVLSLGAVADLLMLDYVCLFSQHLLEQFFHKYSYVEVHTFDFMLL